MSLDRVFDDGKAKPRPTHPARAVPVNPIETLC